jgi:chromosome segregation ATPase
MSDAAAGHPAPAPGDERVRLLESRCAAAERLLEGARAELALEEAALAASRARVAADEEALRLTRQHAHNLEDLRVALERRVGELDAQCAHLTGVIGRHEAELGRLRATAARKAAMEASFSWRITAPLRALRRILKPRGDGHGG